MISLKKYHVIILLILFAACEKNNDIITEEDYVKFELCTDTIRLSGNDETFVLKIKAQSNIEWKINPTLREWISTNPSEGVGDADVMILTKYNNTRSQRSMNLKFVADDEIYSVCVIQPPGDNIPPSSPTLLYPDNNDQGISIFPKFKWSKSSDINNDTISYIVSYSADNISWYTTDKVLTTELSLPINLENNTEYFWKVTSSDNYGGESISDVYKFRTNNLRLRKDGESWVYNDDEINGPIPLIFIGDGYVASDFVEEGLFDTKSDEGIKHFFSIEPLKSMRHHFTVYKVAAHSLESGISKYELDDSHLIEKVNTAFSTRYYGNGRNSTLMATDREKVFQYAKKIEGITDEALTKTTIVLLANCHIYSGTCWWEANGRSISIVPTCDDKQAYSYRMTLVHEASGHGFGRLGDEYLHTNREINSKEKYDIINWSKSGYYSNIDITNDYNKIKWAHFINDDAYPYVAAYEGAQFLNGVWMPEPSSCMREMSNMYFNAPSREAIFSRVMNNLNIPFDFESFKQFDSNIDLQPSKYSNYVQRRSPGEIKHTPPQKSYH